jgi:hypothetical protein
MTALPRFPVVWMWFKIQSKDWNIFEALMTAVRRPSCHLTGTMFLPDLVTPYHLPPMTLATQVPCPIRVSLEQLVETVQGTDLGNPSCFDQDDPQQSDLEFYRVS